MTTRVFAGNQSLLTGLLFFLAACGLVQVGTLGVLTYGFVIHGLVKWI